MTPNPQLSKMLFYLEEKLRLNPFQIQAINLKN